MTPPGRSREAARKRSTDQLRASACLGTDAKTSRAMRRMLPASRCWASIAVTTLSPGSRPTAAAYSVRRKTGCALKKGAEMSRDTAISPDTLSKSSITIYEVALSPPIPCRASVSRTLTRRRCAGCARPSSPARSGGTWPASEIGSCLKRSPHLRPGCHIGCRVAARQPAHAGQVRAATRADIHTADSPGPFHAGVR